MRSNMRHMVYTPEDSFVEGVHGLSAYDMNQAFEGYLGSTLTGRVFTNAEHSDFISMFQALATLWRPAFLAEKRNLMDPSHPGMF